MWSSLHQNAPRNHTLALLYGKGHSLTGSKMPVPEYKVRFLIEACNFGGFLCIGLGAWSPQTGILAELVDVAVPMTICRAKMEAELEVQLSARTVRQRLPSAGLRGCVAAKKPWLKAETIRKRLHFARQHKAVEKVLWSAFLWGNAGFCREESWRKVRPTVHCSNRQCAYFLSLSKMHTS